MSTMQTKLSVDTNDKSMNTKYLCCEWTWPTHLNVVVALLFSRVIVMR